MPREVEPDDGVYKLSASKLNTWIDCERRFGWTYIAKLPRQENKSAALGSATHAQLEAYLELGKPLDFGVVTPSGDKPAEIAAPGLHLLPPPKTPGLEVEKYFKWISPKGHTFIGYKDVRWPREIPLVIDHKTSSNIAAYALTSEGLRKDVQATIYAADEFSRAPDAPAVDLEWIYYSTRGRRHAEKRALRVLRDDPTFLSMVAAVDVAADAIAHIVSSKTLVTDLRPNAAACEKYGGCPFQANCNLGPSERFRSMSNAGKGTEDLMSRLLERAGQAAPAATASKPAQDDAIAALLGGGPKRALDVPGAIYTNGIPSVPTLPPAAALPPAETLPPLPLPAWADPKVTPVDPLTGRGNALQTALSLSSPGAIEAVLGRGTHPQDPINPPEAQRAPTPEERTAEDAAAKAAKAGPPKEGGSPRFRRTQAEIDAGLTVEQAKAARATLPGYAAPLAKQILDEDAAIKAEIAADPTPPEVRDATPEDIAALLNTPGPSFADVNAAVSGKTINVFVTKIGADGEETRARAGDAPAAAALDVQKAVDNWKSASLEITGITRIKGAPTLYIDCMPLGRAVKPVTDLISVAHKALKEDKNVVDYRLLFYGEGAALLSFGVAHLAEESPEDLYLDTRTPEGAVVKDRLAAVFGARVIQGVR